MNKTHFFATRS